jgi:molybdate transport system regulatory protein
MAKKSSGLSLHPCVRVLCGEEIALGPGKVELLALVEQTGSIREAADRMGMSYMRAWTLLKTMNACFKKPLVEAVRGGPAHGGTKLTETGKHAVQLYGEIEGNCLAAAKSRWLKLRTLLRNG